MCVASATQEREGKRQKKKQRDHTSEVVGLQKPYLSAFRVFWVTVTLAFYRLTPFLLSYLRPEAARHCPPRERKGVTRKEEGGEAIVFTPNL